MAGLQRFENWPELLAGFLAQHANTPFEWGRQDCALFACDAIHIMTGVDLAESFRLQYQSALGASKQIQKALVGMGGNPFGGLEELALRVCLANGMEEIPVELAGRGDLLLGKTALDYPALGIVDVHGTTGVFVGVVGLRRMGIRECEHAWRVG